MPSSYTIGERYEKLIQKMVASGRYASASEVVRDSLRLLEERDAKLAHLRHLVQEGITSGKGGRLDVQALKAEARRRRK